MSSDRAVFLDKDGTLVEDVPYNVDPSLVRLAEGAGFGLRTLQDAGFRLFVVSNQAGVALGRFAESALKRVEAKLRELLREFGVTLDGFLYCPHHPSGLVEEYAIACDCRKPAPGMILRAAESHDLDLSQSWLIGDILDDIEAGRRAGCQAILLDNGHETEWLPGPDRVPHHIAADLGEAARIIISGRHRQRACQRPASGSNEDTGKQSASATRTAIRFASELLA
jgi:D-glycero-D-manno-heptose 1,7-bisphosphate phosphatase